MSADTVDKEVEADLKNADTERVEPKIFFSYNPDVRIEQSTALRLQTMGALYNCTVYLPDRLGAPPIKDSTIQRINESDIAVLFSTVTPSQMALEEIQYAIHIKKRVIIFYDSRVGKNINIINAPNVIEEFITPTDTLDSIMRRVKEKVDPSVSPESKNMNGAMTMVGIGIGLFLLWAMTKDDK